MSIFLNDMLTKGAIIGGLMLASNVAETAMFYYGASYEWMAAVSFEMLAVFAIYVYLMFRFTRNYASMVIAERKDMPYFSYASGLSYVVSVSMLAAVIVALGGYMFRHYVIGYENYIDSYVKSMQSLLSQTEVPASMVSTYDQMFKAIKSQSEPSLISTIFSTLWSYLFASTIVGLIVAAFTRKEPKLFDNEEA